MKLTIVQDTYAFACTRCGECCFDQEVYLEPPDVWALPSREHIEFVQVEGEWRCRLVFRPWAGKGKKCPYLQHDGERSGCSIHAAKPFVCAFSPLARKRNEDIYYMVPPVDGCPGIGKGSQRFERSDRLALSIWYQDTYLPTVSHDREAFVAAYAPQCGKKR